MNAIPGGGLILLEAGPKGRGVFSTRRFRKGEVVLAFEGDLIPEEEIIDFTYTIQVDEGLYLGPSGGIDDYVNHSCEPTTLLRSDPPRLELVASRAILPGEEITFDYATCISRGPTLGACLCGVPSCRGAVGTFWDLDEEARTRFEALGAVPDYVLRASMAETSQQRGSKR